MGNEIPRHVEQAQKTGVLQLRDFKLDKVYNYIFIFLTKIDLIDSIFEV